MNDNENIKQIEKYIRSGEKKREDFTIGVEMEHFIVDNKTGESISYYGKNGVNETLSYLKDNFDFTPVIENGQILSLESDLIFISTEPGSQFEIAIKSQKSVSKLNDIYLDFMPKVLKHLEEKNQSLVTLGYHPVTRIEDIKILPKIRYDHMYNYFKKRGSMAHNMMKGSASVQTAIDYENEDDFRLKVYLLNVFSPVFYAMYDNAYIFQGSPTSLHTIRQKIWENTDSERSGLYKDAFDKDFSYKTYAKKIYNTPIIFREKDGLTYSTQTKTLKEVCEDIKLDDELIFHSLSIVFPDVRVKKYIEIRMFDSLPYPLNFSVPALIKGLFYSEKNLQKLLEISNNTTYDQALKAKKDIIKEGLNAKYLNMDLNELSKIIYQMAYDELQEEDKKFLKPLKPYVENKLTPRDIFEKIYRTDGLLKAIDVFKIRLED
ncbi:MAG: glutamate-cysteine ligase family protein [Lagierella massiliensis]|nr:glutamate-cysteine ligase family protein [Lagierella massiliensis]